MLILESELQIKNTKVLNRIVLPPMGIERATMNGKITDEILAYYDARSKNEHLGTIIVEHSYVDPVGKAGKRQISIAEDDDLAGLTRLAEAIHRYDTKTLIQINHGGAAVRSSVTGEKAVSASPLDFGQNPEPAHELTIDEIQRVEEKFVQAALRAQRAGFDGVEIHSAHGYLLNQFYSPYFNKRTDGYGGSLANRIRIHLEIIQKIKKRVTPDFLIYLRLGACDFIEGGATIEDAIQAAKAFEKAGVDVIDISGGATMFSRPGKEGEQGYFSDVSKAIKAEIDIPVIVTGGITKLSAAEKILETNAADFIGIGRPMLRDANWLTEAFQKYNNR